MTLGSADAEWNPSRRLDISFPRPIILVVLLIVLAAPVYALPPGWYTPPAGAPYTSEELRVRSHETHSLGGTLTVPTPTLMSNGRRLRYPAVVLVTGAGKQNRDHTAAAEMDRIVTGVTVYRPYYDLADTLSRRGIAVLRLDDRGVGGSTGSQDTATTFDRSYDIRAAIEVLRRRPDIDSRRIGIVGLSEGALIATMIASADSTVRGIVLMGSPSANGRETIRWQRQHGVGDDAALAIGLADSTLAVQMSDWDRRTETDPWLRFFAAYDPTVAASGVTSAAVLIVQGDEDAVVPAEGAERLGRAMRDAGNRDVTVRRMPGLMHSMLRAQDFARGAPVDPAAYRLPLEVRGTIAEWVASRFGGPSIYQPAPVKKKPVRRRRR